MHTFILSGKKALWGEDDVLWCKYQVIYEGPVALKQQALEQRTWRFVFQWCTELCVTQCYSDKLLSCIILLVFNILNHFFSKYMKLL